MQEFHGNMLSPVDGKHDPIMIFHPVNTTNCPSTDLQLQIRDQFPNIFNHYDYWCHLMHHQKAKFKAGCISVECLPMWGFDIATCCLFDITPTVDVNLDDIKACIADITDKQDKHIIRIPYKLGRHEWLMSDAQWHEITDMLLTNFPDTRFEIWHHESPIDYD